MNPIQLFLVTLYLASVAFGIFLTEMFRLPAPMVFCMPLVFFWNMKNTKFLYTREVTLLIIAVFLYNVVGLSAYNSFFATSISIILCSVFFSYYIHFDTRRFYTSVWIFYGLLLLSSLVMVANHWFPQANVIRAMIMGAAVIQSPAGISLTQFGYGYQLAAFVPFALISTFVFRKNILIKVAVFGICMAFVFLGMQRSVFVGFALAMVLFLLLYYGFKSIIMLGAMTGLCILLFSVAGSDTLTSTDNILTKNEHNDEASNRTDLASENLKIYAEYPYGLIFYGKDWSDVIYKNYVFSAGITSHNAYLMFFTYLGPFLGLGLLAAVYLPVGRIMLLSCRNIHAPDHRMIICLLFSFLGVSVNALSHNPWLFSADGPTIFSFFCVLHCYKQQQVARSLHVSQNHSYVLS